MFGIEKDFQNLMEQVYGPLNKDKMTEIEKTKKEIEVLTKKLSFLEELYQKEVVKQKDDYPYKKYTPEQTAQSLKEAFVKAQQTENWKETQKLIDEEDNDKNFKNSLDLIKEWGEKNKPQNLTDLIFDWWDDVFTTHSNWDMETSIEDLVDRIDKKFIPPSSDKNGYEWEKCLKMMREKLR